MRVANGQNSPKSRLARNFRKDCWNLLSAERTRYLSSPKVLINAGSKAALEIRKEPLACGAVPNPASAWTVVFGESVHQLAHGQMVEYCAPGCRKVVVYPYSCISKLFVRKQFH